MLPSSSMSAPAIHESALPLKITTALIAGFDSISLKQRAKTGAMRELSVLTEAPGASYVSTPTPSSSDSVMPSPHRQ
jgi:hypothetical protein